MSLMMSLMMSLSPLLSGGILSRFTLLLFLTEISQSFGTFCRLSFGETRIAESTQKMFHFEKTPQPSLRQEKDNETIFHKVLSLLLEATDMLEEKEDLTEQTRQMQRKIGDMECLEEDYMYLKSQIFIYGAINEHLREEFIVLQEQLEAQATLRDKHQRKQKELEKINQSNEAFETVLKELILKLRNPNKLKENYQAAKDEKEILTQENTRLEMQIQKVQKQLSIQNQMEKEWEEEERCHTSLEMNIQVLEKQLEGLEDKLWEKETNFMTGYTQNLQIKISQLQKQLKDEKYWTDKLKNIKSHWRDISETNSKLQTEHEKLKLELRKAKRLKDKHGEIQSVVQAKEEENAFLLLENLRLRKELQNLESTEDKVGKSACPPKTDERERGQPEQTLDVISTSPVHSVGDTEDSFSQGDPHPDDQCTDNKAESIQAQSETDSESLKGDDRMEVSSDLSSSPDHDVDETEVTEDHGCSADETCDGTEPQQSNQRERWWNVSLYNMLFALPKTTHNYFIGRQ